MILRRIVRTTALGIAVLVPGALGLACPAKDLDVVITQGGVVFLGFACSQAASCAGKLHAGCLKSAACAWDGSACRGKCRIPGNPDWSFDGHQDLQVLLFSSNPARFRRASECVALAPCPADDLVACTEKSLNVAVTAALSAGAELTFDGFQDPSDGLIALAIFQRPDGADSAAPPSCAPERLVACAGLDVPLNETRLDLECASCQDGPRTAVGESTRPCPANLLDTRECFLRTCFAALGGTIAE